MLKSVGVEGDYAAAERLAVANRGEFVVIGKKNLVHKNISVFRVLNAQNGIVHVKSTVSMKRK